MLKLLINEHSNLLHKHQALKGKYVKSEKECQEIKIKYVELIDEHALYKNKYMRVRRNFECICILYVIMGGLYYIDILDAQVFHIATIIMILLSLILSKEN